MNKTRYAIKCFAGVVTSAVLILGAVSAPAQAMDTGWGKPISGKDGGTIQMMDTGWGKP